MPIETNALSTLYKLSALISVSFANSSIGNFKARYSNRDSRKAEPIWLNLRCAGRNLWGNKTNQFFQFFAIEKHLLINPCFYKLDIGELKTIAYASRDWTGSQITHNNMLIAIIYVQVILPLVFPTKLRINTCASVFFEYSIIIGHFVIEILCTQFAVNKAVCRDLFIKTHCQN